MNVSDVTRGWSSCRRCKRWYAATVHWHGEVLKSNQIKNRGLNETTLEVLDEFTPARQARLTEATLGRVPVELGLARPDPGNTMELGTAGCVIPWRTHYIALGILWEIVYGADPARPGPRSTVKCSPIRITGTARGIRTLLSSSSSSFDLPWRVY